MQNSMVASHETQSDPSLSHGHALPLHAHNRKAAGSSLHSERDSVLLGTTRERRGGLGAHVSHGLDAEQIVVVGSEALESESPFGGHDCLVQRHVLGLLDDIALLQQALDVQIVVVAQLVRLFEDFDEAELGGVMVVCPFFDILS